MPGFDLKSWADWHLFFACFRCGWSQDFSGRRLIDLLGEDIAIEVVPFAVGEMRGCKDADCEAGFRGGGAPRYPPFPGDVEDTFPIDEAETFYFDDMQEWHSVWVGCSCGHQGVIDRAALLDHVGRTRMFRPAGLSCTRCGKQRDKRLMVRRKPR